VQWLVLVAVVIIGLFGGTLLFGAPFLPTLGLQTKVALDLLELNAGQTLLELGSGDGRVLRAAAQRGIHSIGYEINPLLVLYSKLATFKYRKLVKVHWKNYWHVSLPAANAIYVFLLNPYMQKLDDKIVHEYRQPIKVISFAFAFPKRRSTKEKNGVMLYNFAGVKEISRQAA
jgi:hypothetical protein